MFYFVRAPWWLKKCYPGLTWDIPSRDKVLYLSFDDGPHPEITPFVLDELNKYGAKATFFCIGKNVEAWPQVYKRILTEGHRVGNHTQDHVNGWKTPDKNYLENIGKAAKWIDSNLFRPPYGRISVFQASVLRKPPLSYRIVMWGILSADFDQRLSSEKCTRNVIKNARPGSIVVFHDSEKAFDRLRESLPAVLEHFSRLGYRFDSIKSQ
jgi:peptidoglycan/xylan/chitin deacetylase (PgdA/CDA1 family)